MSDDLQRQITANRGDIEEGKKVVYGVVAKADRNEDAITRNAMDITKLGDQMSTALKDIGDVKTNDAAQTEALKALTETAKHTRSDIKALRDETKASVEGLAARVLDEMSAKRKDDSKANMRALGILGTIIATATTIATWYITGSIPEKPAPTTPGIEASP